MVQPMSAQCVIRQLSHCLLGLTHGTICGEQILCSDMNFQVSRIQVGVWRHRWMDF